MKTIRPTRLLAGLAGLGFAAALWPSAYAQTETQPTTRAEVKEQTRAANKAGQLMPSGEVNAADQPKPAKSTKTREQRKAETLEANRSGGLGSPGQSLYKSNMSQKDAVAHTTKTRADRKAETQQAAKEHKMTPAGDAPDTAKK